MTNRISELTLINQNLDKKIIEISRNKEEAFDKNRLIEKELISNLLKSLLEKNGQPDIQKQLLEILCKTVDLTIKEDDNSRNDNGKDLNISLSDLWISYLMNKTN